MIRPWAALGLTLCLLLSAPQARADDADGPSWSLKGFGTIAAVGSTERNADFVTVRYQPEGAGATHRIDTKPDSRFGLQFDASLNDRFSGVLQVVTQQQANGAYSPQIEWANLRFRITPDWSVRVGRVALPVLMVSDYRLVGFSNLAVRPPVEAYGIIPNTSIDGIDTTWRTQVGSATNSLQVVYGKWFRRYPNAGSIDVPIAWGISDWFETGPLSIHASFSYPKLTWRDPQADALFGGLQQLGGVLQSIPGLEPAGAQTAALARRYALRDERSSIVAIGATYDKDPWLVAAEWMRMSHAGFLPTNTTRYVTAGYRFGPFMPYASYSDLRASDLANPVVPTAGLPPPLAQAGAQLTEGLQDVLRGQNYSQRTVAAGFRWEIRSNFDLKMQVDRVKPAPGTCGLLVNIQPGYQQGRPYHLFSVAVDFVF